MPYLGNNLQVAYPTYRVIDDVSGSFNGVTTSFALLVGGLAPVPLPLNSQQCLISVGGVIQKPDDSGAEGFRLSGGNIVFSSAPNTGEDFFGVVLAGADYVNAGGAFPDGSVSVPSITFDSDTDTGFYRSGAGTVAFTSNGVQASTFSPSEISALNLRLNGATSGYSQISPPAVAGNQTFTLPGTGGTLDRLNRAGNVLQVVQGTLGTQASTSSSTFADTGLTATITPTSASSKILVSVHHAGCYKTTGNTALQIKLLRNGSDIFWLERLGGDTQSTGTSGFGTVSTMYLDSPATTSALTYKTQYASSQNTALVAINTLTASIAPTSTITLMEIAA